MKKVSTKTRLTKKRRKRLLDLLEKQLGYTELRLEDKDYVILQGKSSDDTIILPREDISLMDVIRVRMHLHMNKRIDVIEFHRLMYLEEAMGEFYWGDKE